MVGESGGGGATGPLRAGQAQRGKEKMKERHPDRDRPGFKVSIIGHLHGHRCEDLMTFELSLFG